jgi:hypothetical protein
MLPPPKTLDGRYIATGEPTAPVYRSNGISRTLFSLLLKRNQGADRASRAVVSVIHQPSGTDPQKLNEDHRGQTGE